MDANTFFIDNISQTRRKHPFQPQGTQIPEDFEVKFMKHIS